MNNMEEKAIKLVVRAFEGKKRIKEDIDACYHSLTVGYMLKDNCYSQDIVISGFLHDLIEDTDYGYEYIKNNFGQSVADNVLKVSEDISIEDWKERKKIFIDKMNYASKDILLIEIADKLHNLISDYDNFLKIGKEALATLNTTYEMNKWYYTSLQKIFNDRITECNLLNRYNKMIELYFN